MNVSDMYPSKWISADDLAAGDLSLTITELTMHTFRDDPEPSPVLYFSEVDQGFAVNKTNANAIAQLHGPETDDWTGKRITLFRQEVEFAGKMVWGSRVRLTVPGPAVPAPQVEEGPPEPVEPGEDRVPF